MFFFSETDHELVRDGTSQSERSVAALSPDYVKVDERRTEELLNFIYQYARQINYYQGNPEQRVGDWTPFFGRSVPFQIALIAKYDSAEIMAQFQALKQLAGTTLVYSDLSALFDLSLSLVETLDQWYQGLEGDRSGIQQSIANLIETNLSFSLKRLLGYTNAARAWGYQASFDLNRLSRFWGVDLPDNLDVRFAIDRTLVDKKGSRKAKITFALAAIEENFLTIYKGLDAIVAFAKKENTVEESIAGVSDHSPHLGLLFAFLRLLKRLQGDINRLTDAHLKFFYEEVLQLKTRKAVPDRAHLVFALAQQLEDHLLPKGTRLKAGTDENGEDVVFALEEELVVTKTRIAALKTLYIDQEKSSPDDTFPVVKDLYYAPDATKADGVKEKFSKKVVSSWKTLGDHLSKFRETPEADLKAYPFARLGLILASKVLWLREGTRTITVRIDCNKVIPQSLNNQRVFKVKFSGEEGWFYPQDPASVVNVSGGGTSTLQLDITLQPTELPVFFPGTEFFEADYGHVLPMIALEFDHVAAKKDPEKIYSIYNDLRCLKITDIQIDVTVCGVRNLVIQDDEDVLDANKPFFPFGATPRSGSSNFYVGSEEIFSKLWTGVDVKVRWKDRPNLSDLAAENYYAVYPRFRDGGLRENDFKVDVAYLLAKEWNEKEAFKSRYLFAQDDQAPEKERENICGTIAPETTIFNLLPKDFIDGDDASCDQFQDPFEDLNADTQCGFLRFTLSGDDFQHLEYPNVLSVQLVALGRHPDIVANAVYKNSNGLLRVFTEELVKEAQDSAYQAYLADTRVRYGGKLDDDNKYGLNDVRNEANESEIEIDELKNKISDTQSLLSDAINQGYSAYQNSNKLTAESREVVLPNPPYTPEIETLVLDYSATANLQQTQMIHLYPDEGTYLLLQDAEDHSLIESSAHLLPQFIHEGTLFIGLSELEPGSNLNLLFQIAESTADPEVDKASVCWQYLRNNEWKNLERDFHILSDGTDGFIRSGIVALAIPTDISNEKTSILPGHLHWIKASAPLRTAAIGETIAVYAQAATAIYQPSEQNSATRLSEPLAAETIGKFVEGEPAIDEILQPFSGFGGRTEESPATFYTRISEHLRHKGRAITLYDYERLILQAFPQIYKVKCITHTYGRKGRDTKDIELAPGYVTIVVIPDLRQFKVVDPFEPRASLSLLDEIQDFLKDKTSPFVELKVLNPRYEQIFIEADVKFRKGKSVDFYTEQLIQDIRRFLAPWAFESSNQNISFGGKIFKSTILKFVEDRDYVDYVINFVMKDFEGIERDPITARTARSILLSASSHEIVPFTQQECNIDNPRLANMTGIGYDKIVAKGN
ncbi:MAG: hypothetical protein R2824_18850 [Saprospiraceae bacterium]|nr:baseplate J/gp47 family protein [Lewinella sp.]